jgi:hypothetical protein
LFDPDQEQIIAGILHGRALRLAPNRGWKNLWWAVGYNVIAFPLAAGVLYPFLLGPNIAALAMSGSSALVAINALMLKRTKLTGIRRHYATASPVVVGPAMPAS